MAEEDCPAWVAIVSKFDRPHHQSAMTPKDVKLLARKYDISLDLHPCAQSEGWTMDKLPKEVIGLYEQFFEFSRFFFIDRRAIPDAMAWRHHDSDVNDVVPDNDFSIVDVRAFAENAIDLRIVHPDLLFTTGLAIRRDFPIYHPFSKILENGAVVPSNHQAGQSTTPPLPMGQPIPDKTKYQLEVEVEDPKVFAAREKKKLKKRKTRAKKANTIGSDHVSSPTPIRTVTPTGPVSPTRPGSDGHDNKAQTVLENEPLSPRESANESVNNFINIVDDKDKDEESPPQIESFVNQSGRPLNIATARVLLSKTNADVSSHKLDHSNLSKGLSTGGPQSQATLKRVNPPDPLLYMFLTGTSLIGAVWTLQCGVERGLDIVQKLVTARQDLEHNARLYTGAINRYKELKEEHGGCNQKMGTFRETLSEGNEGSLHLGPERPRVYSDPSPQDKDRYNADIWATNILLQGLPKYVYSLINHYTDAKDIWDNVKMLLEGSVLTKEVR
ncbi:hypothetical protein Tco_1056973 [Tanacetum coccineum]|uniref:Integrase, catalytic region, zinc finger, CCHC-type, peptidase aspartic, catalytic n=1 Tax=Tanacetum coccineum TaxID=301880 RepID=A0ABQ5H530_9ASTR